MDAVAALSGALRRLSDAWYPSAEKIVRVVRGPLSAASAARAVSTWARELSSAIGGPIVRDKTFYFAAADYTRQDRTTFLSSSLPAFVLPADGGPSVEAPLESHHACATGTLTVLAVDGGRMLSFNICSHTATISRPLGDAGTNSFVSERVS